MTPPDRYSEPLWFPSLLVLCLVLGSGLFQASGAQPPRGYRLTRNAIVVDTRAHWQHWKLPTHAVDLTADARVRPHLFRRRYNILNDIGVFSRPLSGLRRRKRETAVFNIDSTVTLDVKGQVIRDRKDKPLFTYFERPGISRVGSNPRAAANILDGDPNTFWEPDPRDPLEKWWIELDLGRVVPVDEIVLNFVEPELGDPFRQFRVLAAPDQETIFQNEAKVDFEMVGGTDAPTTKRRFSFALKQLRADPNFTGKMVETIRIVISDTRGGQGKLISEAEWQALPPGDRGDIVYFIKDQQGFEEPVEQSVYASLSPARQGRRDHYLRERPRLADIEVWGFGDNISPGMVAGGGSLFLTGGNFAPGPGFDGDFSTNFLHLVFSPTIDRGVLTVDMGATFWLDAMRISTSRPQPFIDGYIVRGSDGSRDTNGLLKWRRISPRSREDNSVDRFEHLLDSFDPAPKLRYLEAVIISADPRRRGGYNTGPTIAEYQLFSKGYPAEVLLTSDLVELPAARNFGAITWKAETPPGTRLSIRTRTGDLLAKIIRYFDSSGTEISFNAWKNLLGSFRGPADTVFVPTRGWSPWSRSYEAPGDRVTSPGLRRFLQIQVGMSTQDRNAAASIRSIGIELVNPVAERLVAELWPIDIAHPGQIDTFEVFLRPDFIESPSNSRSLGFDELLLQMPASRRMELLELGLGVDEMSGRAEQVFRPSPREGVFVADGGRELQLLSSPSDSIWVRLPQALNILPAGQSFRVYNRITSEGEQVPVSQDGLPLSGADYGVLNDDEKGDIRYFRQRAAGGGTQLSEVDQRTYQSLPSEEQGPIRYFRIVRGDGAQVAFDSKGDSLDMGGYRRLGRSQRGLVIGPGALVRLRFSAPVFLNGTTLRMAVRNTGGGTRPAASWQTVQSGDATALVGGNTLSLNVPFSVRPLAEFGLAPNPFTPNGDGINDVIEISFSVFKITAPREAKVRIFSLDGRAVWETTRMVSSGRATVPWDGTDDSGQKVTPGLYICQVKLDVDDSSGATTRSRVLSVVY